jgi:hypothetical protein
MREEQHAMAYPVVGREFEDLLYRNDRTAICRYLLHNFQRLDTSRADYINVERGMLTFLPAGREHVSYPDGSWSRKGRQTGKPGRVVKMLIPKDDHSLFTDTDVETFVNIIKSADITQTADFVEVRGTEIKEWYSDDRYKYGSGTLDTSCMRHSRCWDYFGLYTENPDIVRLLCLIDKQEHLLVGRALVWTIPGYDTPIMDRVYGSDSAKQAFRDYAEDRGWYSRAFHSYEHETEFIKDGEPVHLDISVQMPVYRFPWYPYLDTLKYFDWHTGTFANTPSRTVHAVLMNTRGEGAPWNWATIPHHHEGVTLIREITREEARELQQRQQPPYPQPTVVLEPNWDAPATVAEWDDDDADDDDDVGGDDYDIIDDAEGTDPPHNPFWGWRAPAPGAAQYDPAITSVALDTGEWVPPTTATTAPVFSVVWHRTGGGPENPADTVDRHTGYLRRHDEGLDVVAVDEATPFTTEALDRVSEAIRRMRERQIAIADADIT